MEQKEKIGAWRVHDHWSHIQQAQKKKAQKV